ncbi:hypothetical protein KAR91_43840 [Candidatus Pacearchaeota archaeon]|nr:hypothetical protein [Candidatus Pacearchaeota archaeon]
MANGDPTGSDVASVTIDASTLPHRFSTDWTKFTFDATANIVSGEVYAIVVGPEDLTIAEKLEWNQDVSAGYANGLKCLSDDSGSTWSQISSRDLVFKTYDGAVQKDNFTTGGSWQAIYNPYYLAQTFTASSSYTISSVDLQLRRGVATAVVGNVTISIRLVEGGLPGKPITPTPSHEASDITLHGTTGTWVSGGNTDSYNVYYGTLSGFLELVESGVVDLSLALVEGQFSVYGRISYWRVDAVNEAGIAVGDEWYFTTMLFGPPLPTGVTLDYGEDPPVPTGTPTGENNMMTVRKLIAAANGKIWYEDL